MTDTDRGHLVYVGGLNQSVQKGDIDTEFRRFGALKSVWLAYNPPGFAFVKFEQKNDAEEACRALNNSTVLGPKLRVEMSESRGGFRGGGRGGGRGRGRGGRGMFVGHQPPYASYGRGEHFAHFERPRYDPYVDAIHPRPTFVDGYSSRTSAGEYGMRELRSGSDYRERDLVPRELTTGDSYRDRRYTPPREFRSTSDRYKDYAYRDYRDRDYTLRESRSIAPDYRDAYSSRDIDAHKDRYYDEKYSRERVEYRERDYDRRARDYETGDTRTLSEYRDRRSPVIGYKPRPSGGYSNGGRHESPPPRSRDQPPAPPAPTISQRYRRGESPRYRSRSPVSHRQRERESVRDKSWEPAYSSRSGAYSRPAY